MTLTHQLNNLLDETQGYPLDVSRSISISPRQAQQILNDKEKLEKIEDVVIEEWRIKSSVILRRKLNEILYSE